MQKNFPKDGGCEEGAAAEKVGKMKGERRNGQTSFLFYKKCNTLPLKVWLQMALLVINFLVKFGCHLLNFL